MEMEMCKICYKCIGTFLSLLKLIVFCSTVHSFASFNNIYVTSVQKSCVYNYLLLKRTIDIVKKWDGKMSLKRVQKTCTTESK
jgi:hypothetical protein